MDQNTKKQMVAESVLDYIDNGEVLGIGSGSTVNILIGLLPKVKNKIQNIVSSSAISTKLLEANGFEVQELNSIGRLTKYIDGADEVNKYINEETPWKRNIDEAIKISSTAINAFYILSIYLHPIIPNITNEAFKFLKVDIVSFNDIII